MELGSVGIVHDYLNQRGGAERVVLALAEIFPDAPIYTSLYRPESTFPEFRGRDMRVSPLDRLPVDRSFRNMFPLYPAAFGSFGRLAHDVVISSSSGWAHSVRTAGSAFHAVYCYTPARWLYSGAYMNASRRQRALRPALTGLRTWDRAAARRADLYIAISREIRDRIKREYGFDAPVVYPPVDVDRFTARPRGERLLVVSRLLAYKRIEVIVEACTRVGMGIDIVGGGPELEALQLRAGPSVSFHGRLPDPEVTELLEHCRALVLPGHEDFGITPVEAHAAGKPVIAFAAGGALETVQEGFDGTFFPRHDPSDVLDAIARCDAITTSSQQMAQAARRFSSAAFRDSLLAVLGEGVAEHRSRLARRPRAYAAH